MPLPSSLKPAFPRSRCCRQLSNLAEDGVGILLVVGSAAPGRRAKLRLVQEINAPGSEGDIAQVGKQIVFISDRAQGCHYDVCVMVLDDSKAKALFAISFSRYKQEPTFPLDGKSIFFLAGVENNAGSRPIFSLCKTGMDGKNPQEIADIGLFTNPMKWKPRAK